jgi:arylsulfatase A-like enzyme
LMHKGGGIAQPSDPPGGSTYMNPTLFHNGKEKKFNGYCTDVFTDAALDFMTKKDDKPFFAYVAYNCPHGPYQVQEADWKPYQGIDLTANAFPKVGQPWATPKLNTDEIAKAYGMIANVDLNFGRMLAKLPKNTLVIFLTDNGPGGVRWNAGLRNRKGTVYEGGIRVPFYVRWDDKFKAGHKNQRPAAHIDITPTILDACDVDKPDKVKLDGTSVLPLLTGNALRWEREYLCFQWHRGDVPELGRAFAIRGDNYKLVQANGVGEGKYKPKEELFDISTDPFEQTDLVATKPEIAKELRKRYEEWFADVKATRNFAGPRIHIGSKEENPSVLTRQDWRGPKAGWRPGDEGHWEVTVARAGKYRITLDFEAHMMERTAHFKMGDVQTKAHVVAKATRVTLPEMTLTKGDFSLEAWLEGEKRGGVTYVQVERVGD